MQKEAIQRASEPGSKGAIFASLGALASVIAAASCCLPLLPFLFAAGTASVSAFVGSARPYLLVVSVLFIGFAFYKSWRARQCNRKPSRISTFLLWFSAIVVFVFIFFPQVIANFLANLLAGRS